VHYSPLTQWRRPSGRATTAPTFGGGPLACRLGFEFVKILQEEEMLEDIREKGDYFETKLLMLKKSILSLSMCAAKD
jgi:acetylornithine/succinyldiaminopimelate/putrescine aminotransferase